VSPEAADVADGLPGDPAGRVEAILQRIVDDLDLEADVSVTETDDEIHGAVDGEDVGEPSHHADEGGGIELGQGRLGGGSGGLGHGWPGS